MCVNNLSQDGERRLRAVYNGIKDRCYNPDSVSYKYYGARGISMCDIWLNSYPEFHDWAIENGYNENAARGECTIDRIDCNGNYEPDNCRWVDMKVQSANKRKPSRRPASDAHALGMAGVIRMNIYCYANDKACTLSEIARSIGISRSSLYEKMDGKRPWLLSEIVELASVMGCEERDIWTIRELIT